MFVRQFLRRQRFDIDLKNAKGGRTSLTFGLSGTAMGESEQRLAGSKQFVQHDYGRPAAEPM